MRGFVDLQVNGFAGIDFAGESVSERELREACMMVLERGTAAFLATLVSARPETYARNLPMLARLCRSDELGGRLLGIHLEGPFIANDVRVTGAHRAVHVCAADQRLLQQLQERAGGCIRLLTMAAEIDGAASLAAAATGMGVRVAVGHSFASIEQLVAARDAGAVALTHFGNALPPELPRHENPIVSGLAVDGYSVMLITDGHHLPRSFVDAVLRIKRRKQVIVVSDLSPAASLPPGRYVVMGQPVEVIDSGCPINTAESHLVGSGATLLQCLNQLREWELLDEDGCWDVGLHNPLRLLGLSQSDIRPLVNVMHRPDTARFEVCGGH